MSITSLEWDEWSDTADNGSSESHPSWERVEDAILSLDGSIHTIVKLSFDADTYMMVAGGQDNNYLVFVTTSDGDFLHVVDPSKSDGKIMLDIGGQPGEYPLKRSVTLNVALDAAKAYFENGECKSALTWQAA